MEQDSNYRMMDLKSLRCFWALGKRGTLTGAGIELGITEPAVSKRIRSLEAYLGKKLYESTGGRVKLTGAGQKLLEMSIALFDRLEVFEQGLGPDSEVTGTVTVAAEDGEQLYLLPPVVEKYHRLFPGVELRLLMHPVSAAVDQVRQNEVDIAIVPKLDFPDGLAFYPWRTFEAYLLMPLGHPLVRAARANFKSLLNRETLIRYPLILSETQETKHHRLREALAALGLPINVAFVLGSMEALKRYVALGLGVAVVSGICLTEEDQAKLAIVQVPPEYGGQTTYGVLIHQRKHIGAPLKGLLAVIGATASEPPIHA